jgi:D-amino-acid oxidase
LNKQKTIYLTPPLVSPEHCKEKITCIRAHRERIFQICSQEESGKLIIHNYGHGGAGWTFLFGAVNEALRIFERHMAFVKGFSKQKIVVVGAGCYGLLTAVMLARKGFGVRIIARETEGIPSTKAAGFFFPRHRKCSNEEEIAIFKRLGQESYNTYLQIIQGAHPFLEQGAKLLSAYYGLDIDPGFGSYISQGLLDGPVKVLVDFNKGKQYEMYEYRTIFIDTQKLLDELWCQVKALGVELRLQEIQSFEELEESMVFNCAGMGAKKLAHDDRIIPVQGHLITLKNQPSIEQLQYMVNVKITMTDLKGRPRDELIYFAPKKEGILGITFLRGQDSLTTNQHEFDRLIERCQKFFGTHFL